MKAWTDYPFVELGDIPYTKAPVRRVEVVSFDGNKYCKVIVNGIRSEIKAGYLYRKAGRCGEMAPVDYARIEALNTGRT